MKRNTRSLPVFLVVLLAGASLEPVLAQTSIPMAPPETISKLVISRAEVERCITIASPDSLSQAQAGLLQSKVISDDDKVVLAEILRGISLILYPQVLSPFFIDPSLKNIQKVDSLLLIQLVEASQGRIFSSTDSFVVSFLAELLPALAIFRTKDLETAQSALAYAERFEGSSPVRSVIPGLVRARLALMSNDAAKAYAQYTQLLAAYPDLWPARFCLGQISLSQNRVVEALNYLEPLVETRRNDPAFIIPYASALYSNGMLATAEPYVLSALEFNPASADMALAEAHINIDRNEFAKAGPYLDILGKKRPNDRMYLYLKTLQYSGLARKDEALKWARKAFQTFPSDPGMMTLLAGVLFASPETGDAKAAALAEATSLAEAARKGFAAAKGPDGQPSSSTFSPLVAAMRFEAERVATHLLLMDAYDHQDWSKAADLLNLGGYQALDKAVVATILRKSGPEHSKEAIVFAKTWYDSEPGSESAAEAYLRSLVGGGILASAVRPGTDAGPGSLLQVLFGSNQGSANEQSPLLGLALKFLPQMYSKSMQSFLSYLWGTLQTDQVKAIDSYRTALLYRSDNVEALVALARIYVVKEDDGQKALSYVKEARMIHVTDKDLDAELLALEKSLAGK